MYFSMKIRFTLYYSLITFNFTTSVLETLDHVSFLSPGIYIIFFLILIFLAVSGVNGQKIAQNEK